MTGFFTVDLIKLERAGGIAMKTFKYETQGTCSRQIVFEMDGDIINNVQFLGGCPGNTLGISQLVKGRKASEIIDMLEGIRCGAKPTSCPDQLAKALKLAISEE